MKKQKALITGASSGIGLELARVMAAEGHDLVLVARSLQELKKVKALLESEQGVSVSVYKQDLALPGAAEKLYAATAKEEVGILVNNAGAGYVSDFFAGDLERHRFLVQLNMSALMELSYLYGKDFMQRGSGKILNVSSIVSFFPGPAQPVYYASKAFVRSLSRALAFNAKGSGVTVTALHPGLTKTSFFDAASAPKQAKGADPAKVARLGYEAMMAGRVEVTEGLWNKFLVNVFTRITPYRLQPEIVSRASDV